MTRLPAGDFARSLWAATAPAGPNTTPLDGDAVADIAIVGGGILGLSAGLALAEAGARVIVLEADAAGSGASGRNGGLVVPSLPRIGPAELAARLGPERGTRLARLVAGSAAAAFGLIARLGIDCEAAQTGWLNPAHAASRVPGVAARVAAWRDAGAACVWLDAAETRRRMGSEAFHGALFDPTGGHINPLAYTRGLARALLAAGGRLHGASPVTAIRRDGGWSVETGAGRVRATTVLQCTNAQHGAPSPAALRDSTVPLTVYQLATPVMPAAIRAAVLAGGEAFSDTRNNLLACRWTAGGRLVTGGMASLAAGAMERLPRRLARRLEAVFPALGPVRFDYVWQGRATLTGDFLPRLFQVAPGWLAPIACNGRGVALCTALGRTIAEAVRTGTLDALPIPISPPRPIRPQALAALAPRALLPLGDWRDRRA